ncbi:MAG: hypothetical protein DIU69_12425 [Bacillota bacterium]|nr:MAG: hypothetical protein DIU69_12425 [Bacillota bacterium]
MFRRGQWVRHRRSGELGVILRLRSSRQSIRVRWQSGAEQECTSDDVEPWDPPPGVDPSRLAIGKGDPGPDHRSASGE